METLLSTYYEESVGGIQYSREKEEILSGDLKEVTRQYPVDLMFFEVHYWFLSGAQSFLFTN